MMTSLALVCWQEQECQNSTSCKLYSSTQIMTFTALVTSYVKKSYIDTDIQFAVLHITNRQAPVGSSLFQVNVKVYHSLSRHTVASSLVVPI